MKLNFTFLMGILIGVPILSETLPYRFKAQFADVAYNPYDVWLITDSKVLVNDLADKRHPIRLISLENGEIVRYLNSGRGPGEVSPTFYKRTTTFSNGDVALFDSGNQRIMVYDSTLTYRYQLRGSAMEQHMSQAGLINDSTMWMMTLNEDFISVYRIRNRMIHTHDLIYSVQPSSVPEFAGFGNMALRESVFISNRDGKLFMTSEHTSWAAAFDESGLSWITNRPDGFGLPEADSQNMGMMRPRLGKHPQGALGVTSHGGTVFVLFHGGIISVMEQIRYVMDFDTLIEKMKHSKRILTFDAETGLYTGEYLLPEPARGTLFVNRSIFLLNSLDHPGAIRVYERQGR